MTYLLAAAAICCLVAVCFRVYEELHDHHRHTREQTRKALRAHQARCQNYAPQPGPKENPDHDPSDR